MAMEQIQARAQEAETHSEVLLKRSLHGTGGSRALRRLSPTARLAHLRGSERSALPGHTRFLSVKPEVPRRNQPFSLCIALPEYPRAGVALVVLELRMPSGKRHVMTLSKDELERRGHSIEVGGFHSGTAGDLSVSARLYLDDGSTLSDARIATVLSVNPHQLVIDPRVWLASGRAGRVEYDFDKDEFHCRAYATISNGTAAAVTYTKCNVRVTDGGVGGTLVSEFSFNVGPFTVAAGGVAHRTLDTWYPKGSDVWNDFNRRWDLTLDFRYEGGGVSVSDSAPYLPMSTVPINAIKCTDFSAEESSAERDAVERAAEILEARDVTLYAPNWRIISSAENKARFGVIDIGWSSDTWDFSEAHDMYEVISGPEGDRLDLFLPLAFAYDDAVPADKRNVGGFSTVNGPFPKDDSPRRSGSLVLVDENDVEFFAVAIAHEICHYLGLEHVEAEDNLMHKNGGLTGHLLTWDQWNTIRQHGMMKWLAPDV
jgi:matrixin